MRTVKFSVWYDTVADVLYLSRRDDAAAHGVQDENGLIWRYSGEGKLIGVTVMDFSQLWSEQPNLVTGKVAQEFDMPRAGVRKALSHVIEDAVGGTVQ